MRRRARASTRQATFVAAVLASMLLGVGLVWVFAPLSFRGWQTGELVAILGLLVLPTLTAWATWAECRVARRPATAR
ncbi:MAG: hypothetical protein ACKVS8_03705 [Phycisphaerales bacterium]